MKARQIGRGEAALEVIVAYSARLGLAPALKWLLGLAALSLPLLPIGRTSYIGFFVVLAVLFWIRRRGESWQDFGLKWPPRWGMGVLIGFASAVISVAISILFNPLLDAWFGPNQAVATFAEVEGNTRLFLFVLPMIWLFAAFGEEVFYRGFLMTRLHQMFGDGRWGWWLALIIQACLFGAAHSYQGLSGVIAVIIAGLIAGLTVRASGGSLVPAMLAHGLIDTFGFTLLYLGLLD